MIQHVYERVQQVPSVGQVLVATDDERIINAVQTLRRSSLHDFA